MNEVNGMRSCSMCPSTKVQYSFFLTFFNVGSEIAILNLVVVTLKKGLIVKKLDNINPDIAQIQRILDVKAGVLLNDNVTINLGENSLNIFNPANGIDFKEFNLINSLFPGFKNSFELSPLHQEGIKGGIQNFPQSEGAMPDLDSVFQQEFVKTVNDIGFSTTNAFLSVGDLLFPFEGIFSTFHKALMSYLQIDESAFAHQIAFLGEMGLVQSVPNFLGLSFEQLFDVPVTEGSSEVTALTFEGATGLVESIGIALNLNSSEKTAEVTSVMSESRTLSTPPITIKTTITTIPVTVTNPTSNPTPPTARDQTIDNVMSSALNFSNLVSYSGNIFKANSYNGNLVATFGPDGGKTITADFVEAIPGSTVTHIRGATILTLPDGNYLTVYTANFNGHAIGDYAYTLIAPHLIVDTTASIEIINGQRFFIDTFEYTLTTNRLLSDTAKITVIIQDDHPTANDVIGASPLMESSIPDIGSGLLTIPHTLTGMLITPATDANPIFFGANGGSITNVTLVGGNTIVNATTILVTDQYGNAFVIDRATGEYTYTLSHAVTNVNGDPLVEVFEYELTDNNGNTANGKISISILDDNPIAFNQYAGTILEANIPVVGSNNNNVPNVLGGDILADNPTTNSTRLGADGGVISSVSLDVFDSATPVSEASNISGLITQQDIDNSQGAFNASNLNHGSITLTDSVGNVLVVDTQTGNYFFMLTQAYQNAVTDGSVTLVFNYTLTDSDGSIATANLTLHVTDDHPTVVAQDAGTMSEANIPVVGSNDSTTANVLGGNLGIHFGADGPVANGGITSISLSSVSGTSGVTEALNVTGLITAQDIANSQGAIDGSSIGHPAVTITDSLGNVLVVDALTGEYFYTLNQSYNNSVPDSIVDLVYTYIVTDKDGSTANSTLAIHIADDSPVAANENAGTIEESNIPVTGSSGETTPNTLSGTLDVRYGADGQATGGGVTNVQFNSVSGANSVTAATTFSQITQVDIDNSNGALSGANFGHNSILVTDSLGNTLLVDAITGQYLYTLNQAFNQTTPNTEAQLNYTISYMDSDGSETSNSLVLQVNDDQPTAVADFAVATSALPDITVTLTSFEGEATANNSYGYYIKDANGDPTVGQIIWAGIKDVSTGATFTISNVDPNDIGYFILPDGARANPDMVDGQQIVFQTQVNTQYDFANDTQWYPVDANTNEIIYGTDGVGNIVPMVIFDSAALNPYSSVGVPGYILDSNGNQGWEDSIINQIYDYNDIIINANYEVNGSDATASGNILNNDIRGADGANASVTEISLSFASETDANLYISLHPELNATLNGTAVIVPVAAQTNVVLTTPEGAELQISSSGDYVYTLPANSSVSTESFNYTIVDADNSASSSTLTIDHSGLTSLMASSFFLGESTELSSTTDTATATTIVSSDMFSSSNSFSTTLQQDFYSSEIMTVESTSEQNSLLISNTDVLLSENEINFSNIEVNDAQNSSNVSTVDSVDINQVENQVTTESLNSVSSGNETGTQVEQGAQQEVTELSPSYTANDGIAQLEQNLVQSQAALGG